MSSKVSPADIEAKLRAIQTEVDDVAGPAKPAALAVGSAIAAGVVGAAFVLGQRKARKRTTVVEIRRV